MEDLEVKRISIIIPVYNAEKTIERCVKSILDNNYSDYEILLVNDGSQDASLTVCEKLSTFYPCVRVVNKSNGGSSSARNEGINNARGEFITFVDSDDFVFFRYLKEIHFFTEKEHDWIVFNLARCCGTTFSFPESTSSDGIFGTENFRFVANFFLSGTRLNSPCISIYRREILERNKIRFNEKITLGEDLLFNLEYFKHIKTIEINNEILYCYVDNGKSVTHNNRVSDYYDSIFYLSKLTEIALQYGISIENDFLLSFFLERIYVFVALQIKEKKSKKKIKAIVIEHPLYNTIINFSFSSKKSKVLQFLLRKKMYYTMYLIFCKNI